MEGGNGDQMCFVPSYRHFSPPHWDFSPPYRDNDLIGRLVLSPVCQLSRVGCMLTLRQVLKPFRSQTMTMFMLGILKF